MGFNYYCLFLIDTRINYHLFHTDLEEYSVYQIHNNLLPNVLNLFSFLKEVITASVDDILVGILNLSE